MIRLVLLLLLIAFILAVRFLPWWGVLLFVAALVLGVRWVGGWLLKSLLLAPFRMKGAVLRGAIAQVHAVEPAEAPPEPAMDEAVVRDGDGDGALTVAVPREYYRIDVTIVPRPTAGPFLFWEPGELLLVPSDSRAREPEPDASTPDEVEVFHEGQFGPDEMGKYPGEQRLRLRFGLSRGGPRRLKFRYYFETFGAVLLPGATALGGP
jgi:hypothetical protein